MSILEVMSAWYWRYSHRCRYMMISPVQTISYYKIMIFISYVLSRLWKQPSAERWHYVACVCWCYTQSMCIDAVLLVWYWRYILVLFDECRYMIMRTILSIWYNKIMISIFYASSAPTLTPTSAPTVSLASIQLQGNAMADIARAIPGLTTLSGMDR